MHRICLTLHEINIYLLFIGSTCADNIIQVRHIKSKQVVSGCPQIGSCKSGVSIYKCKQMICDRGGKAANYKATANRCCVKGDCDRNAARQGTDKLSIWKMLISRMDLMS